MTAPRPERPEPGHLAGDRQLSLLRWLVRASAVLVVGILGWAISHAALELLTLPRTERASDLARAPFLLGCAIGVTIALVAVRGLQGPRSAADPALADRVGTRDFLVIIGLALAARTAWYFLVPTRPVSDFLQYDNLALGLAEKHRYDGADLRMSWAFFRNYHEGPTAFRMPGYPLLLALGYVLLGRNPWWGHALSCLLLAGALLALHTLARRGLSRPLGLVLLGGFAFYPDFLFAASIHGTDFPGAALITMSMALLVSGLEDVHHRLARLLLAGLVFGLAIHCRPNLLVATAVWAALPLIVWPAAPSRSRVAASAAVLAGVLALLVPWAVRNQMSLGSPIVTATSGWHYTAFVNNNPRGWRVVNDRSQPALYGSDEVEMSRLGSEAAVAWARSHPREFLRRGRERFQETLGGAGNLLEWVGVEPVDGDAARIDHIGQDLRLRLFAIANVGYGILLGAAGVVVLGIATSRSAPGRVTGLLTILAATTLAVVALSALVFEGQSRYHFAALPGLMLVTLFGLQSFSSAVTSPADPR